MTIQGLLLAAGGSTRFGSQKLIAPYHGVPLVRYAATQLASATVGGVAVVGNEADAVREALGGCGLRVVENPDWKEGLASSLKRGVASLEPEVEAVVVALGDQPGLEADLVRTLIMVWQMSGQPIVTSRYRGVRSPPVLLARDVFADIALLHGDMGAKPLMDQMPERVVDVNIDAEIPHDVDTVEDLR